MSDDTSHRLREIIAEMREMDEADPAVSRTMFALGWNAALAELERRMEALDERRDT